MVLALVGDSTMTSATPSPRARPRGLAARVLAALTDLAALAPAFGVAAAAAVWPGLEGVFADRFGLVAMDSTMPAGVIAGSTSVAARNPHRGGFARRLFSSGWASTTYGSHAGDSGSFAALRRTSGGHSDHLDRLTA